MNFASFHNVGNVLLFMSDVIGTVMAGATALNTRALILLTPVDFPGGRATSVLFTVCSVICRDEDPLVFCSQFVPGMHILELTGVLAAVGVN